MNGEVTKWNDAVGSGQITDDDEGDIFAFTRAECKARAQNALRSKSIPPDASVAVKFDEDLEGNALNVDTR
jgi:cold shock CspA family protein